MFWCISGTRVPHDLPPWKQGTPSTLDGAKSAGKINDALRVQMRLAEAREADSSVVIIDSQSVQTAEKGAVGVDPHKRRKGRKRQIVVDTEGWLIRVLVHRANEQDSVAGKWWLRRLPLLGKAETVHL